jgi:hypothetical protein
VGEGLIGEILNKYGIGGIAVMIIGLIVLPLSIRYTGQWILELFSGFKKVSEDDEISDDELISLSLREHLFFTNAKFKLRFEIPSLPMSDGDIALQQVYRDLLYLNIESLYYGCKNIAKTPNLEKMSPTQWDLMVKDELTMVLNSYEQKAEDFGVPKIIINRYIRWFLTYNDLLKEFISQISSNDFYGDNISRTNTLFLIMNLLMISMIGDITKLFDETRNDFDGVEYRGSVIEV